MTQNNPMETVYKSILSSYNPLHIKDILIHGASRKAIYHKSDKDIIEFYAVSYTHLTLPTSDLV